jgi:hypothetical protein
MSGERGASCCSAGTRRMQTGGIRVPSSRGSHGSEDLTVEVDEADGGVGDALTGLARQADLVRVPQPRELGAATAERLDELAGLGSRP